MNWFRFNVELFAWGWKTLMSSLSAFAAVVAYVDLADTSTDMLYWSTGEMLIRQHIWLAPAVCAAFLLGTWGLFTWATRLLRADRRYGEK